ncbi:MAG: hypothetical protein MUF20_10240, partial [Methylotetracoccus sp.]|nr:hypothetical protein [Methylotetracoccus sp.]
MPSSVSQRGRPAFLARLVVLVLVTGLTACTTSLSDLMPSIFSESGEKEEITDEYSDWTEEEALSNYPLTHLRLAMALHLTIQVRDVMQQISKNVASLARFMQNRETSSAARLAPIAALLAGQAVDLAKTAQQLRDHGDEKGFMAFEQAHTDH